MRITESTVRRIIAEEIGRLDEGLPGTGPRETFEEIIRICKAALADPLLGHHPQVANQRRDSIETLLSMMDNIEYQTPIFRKAWGEM